MTPLTRILAALAILAALGAPHLVTPPRTAQADLCAACADPDVPEAVLVLRLPVALWHAEGSTHHEQTSAGPR